MSIKKYFTILFLTLSLILGTLTRFYKLGGAPAGLYLDEAAQGYSAYSILKTGKDEFGKEFPVVFRSFTDFKTPTYIYLIVPLIPIFGLTKFTVRFPSFFFSILSLPIFYLLIKKIAPRAYSLPLSLLTTFLLSISPWHILFGRTNFECNVALFFLLIGVYFFYLGLKNPKMLLVSAFGFALAIPSYHAQRVIAPLIITALFLRHRKKLLWGTHKKFLLAGGIIGLILLLPTLSISTTPGFLARASGLNIFTHSRQKPAGYLEDCKGGACPLINNSLFLTTREFSALYFSYFSPRNMFVLGDYGPRSSFPNLSTFFLWQFPFYVIGLYSLIKKKDLKEFRFFTLSLLIIGPIPAAVTRDAYSTIRSLQMVIPQISIISLGILQAFSWLRNKFEVKYFPFAAYLTLFVVTFYSSLRLYSSVIILNEFMMAHEWNFGWKEVAQKIPQLNPNLAIVVDNARSEPYSQLLFFLKADPSQYQRENFEVPLSEYYTNLKRDKTKKIGKITTRAINWKPDLSIEQYLIGDQLAISESQIKEHNLSQIAEVKYPNGAVSLRIVKTNPELSSQKKDKTPAPQMGK